MPDGNDEQKMRVAENIANAVLEKFTLRHPELRQQSPSERLLQWLPLIVAVGTAFWTFAIMSKDVEQNTNDIRRLEIRDEANRAILTEINSRLARIETTLEIVTGGRGGNGRAP